MCNKAAVKLFYCFHRTCLDLFDENHKIPHSEKLALVGMNVKLNDRDLGEISGFHDDNYEGDCLLECYAV
jgi:hypothetical protein